MFGLVGRFSRIVSLLFSVVGVIISFIRLNLLGVWVGMEIRFLSVICFARGFNVEESERIIKYFVIQVLGSCICGLGFLISVNIMQISFSQFFILIGLIIKLGMFPFHFWVAPVVRKLSWAGSGRVLFIQKLVPLWILRNYLVLFKDLSRLEFLCCLTSLVGCLGGLGVLNYRVLLAFSSVQNLGPIVLLCCAQELYLWVYVLVYILIGGFLMLRLWKMGIYGFQDLIKEKRCDGVNNVWWISFYLFSSAGLPPFTGCVIKVALLAGCWNLMPLGRRVCILSSCISLFFYLRVVLVFVVNWGKRLFFLDFKVFRGSIIIGGLRLIINLAIGFISFLFIRL